MRIRSFSLRFFLTIMTIIATLTFLMFATVAMAEKGSDKGLRLSDKSVVALKVDVGGAISFNVAQGSEISLIPKGDGVFVAADPMATDPQRGKKVIYLTNTITIPATKGDAIGHYMITNSRPTWRLDFAHYRTGFPLRT